MLANINNTLSYAGELAGGRVKYDTIVQDPFTVCQHRLCTSILLFSVTNRDYHKFKKKLIIS